MLKCNGATHSVSLPKKHSITSLEEDESMVFVNRDAGPSGSKQSGDFDYPGLALADGNSLWMDNDYPQLYRRLADTLGMEFAQDQREVWRNQFTQTGRGRGRYVAFPSGAWGVPRPQLRARAAAAVKRND